MESNTKNRKTRAQVAGMVERFFDGLTLASGEDALSELKEGWYNAVYSLRLSDGREAVLKIAPPKSAQVMTYEKNIMATEVASMRLVSQNPAIPVPRIYYFDTACDLCDSDYFFMEKIYGDTPEHVKAGLPAETNSAIQLRVGEIVREINGFTGRYFGYDGNPDLRASTWKEAFIKIVDSVLDDGRKKNAGYGFDADEIRAVVLKHAASLEAVTVPRLVHWDAWDLNFLVKDGRLTGILDFERALWADPLMEAQFRALDWAGVSEQMRGYGKTTFTHAEEERCRLYTLHLALVMKTECYYRNYDTDDVRDIAKRLMFQSMKWLEQN
jgi:aminoglycoside phosphotransferase (APT) family kinase protein